MISPALSASLDALWQHVTERKPVLGAIFRDYGGVTMAAYTKRFLSAQKEPFFASRQDELCAIVDRLLSPRVGGAVAKDFCDQLRRVPLVSTADHHAVIDHPYWVNSNIITALPFDARSGMSMRYVPVFSFASVSLNNASAHPRGIFLHGNGPCAKACGCVVPLYPDKMKMSVAYAVRPWTAGDVVNLCSDIAAKEHSGEWDALYAARARALVQEVCGAPEVLALPDFCAQITAVNYRLWPRLFHDASGAEDSDRIDFISLEIESIVREVLLVHLAAGKSLLARLCTDASVRSMLEKHMDGLPGSYDSVEHSGSYLFWGLNDKQHRVRLTYAEGFLVSEDGQIRVSLTCDALTRALAEKRIFPNMFLCYAVIALYYGFTCIGGFSQVNDLTRTKSAWQAWLRHMDESEEALALEHIATDCMNASGIVMASLSFQGSIIPATGIDMVLSPTDTRMDVFRGFAEHATLRELFLPVLPAAYKVFYTEAERDPVLASIAYATIAEETGLADKVREHFHLV
jgi:hypothetical protein